jgi:SWI/SNF-related matrix-associated actin-dependent regulator of chromatin subfamily A member 5
MQLRKVCNHPYLFPDIEDKKADEYGEHIVTNCGKMIFLDKLLTKVKPQND